MTAQNKNCQARRPKTPSARDREAWQLSAEGRSERQVAEELKIAQTTAHRAVLRVRTWMNAVLPEERGEMQGEERLRVVCAEHEVFLRMQREQAMRQWERSCETVQVVKTKVKEYPEGRKVDGAKVTETCTETYEQRQYGRASHLKEARQAAHEIVVLAAGYIGPGNGSIAMTETLDTAERWRWDQAVKSRDARIEELEAAAVGCMSGSEMHAESGLPSESPPLENQNPSRVHGAGAYAPYAGDSEQAVSPTAETQVTSNAENAMTSDDGVYDEMDRRSWDLKSEQETGTQKHPFAGEPRGTSCQLVPAATTDKLAACPTESEEQRSRWSEKYRREALDYHCQIHGLPWADLNQVTGIPDHARVAPKLCIQRGYPYMICINRSIPPDHPPPPDERKVIQLATWEY